MRIGLFQLLAVIGLVAVFAAVLPTHHHAAAAQAGAIGAPHVDEPDAPADDSKPNPHPRQDCPICHAAASLGRVSPPTYLVLTEPVLQFVHPIDQARPAPVAIPLPYDGRAPPAC